MRMLEKSSRWSYSVFCLFLARMSANVCSMERWSFLFSDETKPYFRFTWVTLTASFTASLPSRCQNLVGRAFCCAWFKLPINRSYLLTYWADDTVLSLFEAGCSSSSSSGSGFYKRSVPYWFTQNTNSFEIYLFDWIRIPWYTLSVSI